MNQIRSKPKTKIDELHLLVTLYKYSHTKSPPTAKVLMGLKSEFAPTLDKIDTLRMWLRRHTNRTIRRVNSRRPYRYEVNRQGERRIVFLVERRLRLAVAMAKLGLLATESMVKLYFIARDLEKSVLKRMALFDLLIQYLSS